MTTETKFTKGPWKASKPQLYHEFWHINSPDGANGDIATVWSVTGNAEHNARLIAAAPDLYEAAWMALQMVDGDGGPPDWDMVRAALRKARGESE